MTLTSQLGALESSGLIQLAQTQPEVEYHFRHALVQDAAYASLLRDQRLAARAHGVAGAATAEGPTVVLDTRAPDARFDTRDLWVSPRR